MSTNFKTPKQKEMELRNAKKHAIIAAEELGYLRKFPYARKEIEEAPSIQAITKIMASYRRAS